MKFKVVLDPNLVIFFNIFTGTKLGLILVQKLCNYEGLHKILSGFRKQKQFFHLV